MVIPQIYYTSVYVPWSFGGGHKSHTKTFFILYPPPINHLGANSFLVEYARSKGALVPERKSEYGQPHHG